MFKHFLIIISSISLILLLTSWGKTGHNRISENAALSFNSEMQQFQDWIGYLAEHASDADSRKSNDPEEGPKHYIDIDNYYEFITNGRIPQTMDSVINAHGSAYVFEQGILPWATITTYDSLKACFKRRDWDKAKYFAADLGHYVADGHMPMHITKNYDGQFTGNKGIHSRYESSMVSDFIQEIEYKGGNIVLIDNVNQYIFNYLYQNYQYVDSVLNADDYAQSIASGTSGSKYYNALWDKTQGFTLKLFKNASHSLAELIYSAWVEAGKPYIDPQNGVYGSERITEFLTLMKISENEYKVLIELNQKRDIHLQLYSINGQLLKSESYKDLIQGKHELQFGTNDYNKGLLILKTIIGKNKFVLKICP